jgi:hypothetical protein
VLNRGETRLAISGVPPGGPEVLRPKPAGTTVVAIRVTVSGQIVHLDRSVHPAVQPDTIVGEKLIVTSTEVSGLLGSGEAVALIAGSPTVIWVLPMPANDTDSAFPPPPW